MSTALLIGWLDAKIVANEPPCLRKIARQIFLSCGLIRPAVVLQVWEGANKRPANGKLRHHVPMKICYLSSSHIPSRSANSVHVVKMCSAFVENGHLVSLFAKPPEIDGDPHAFYGVPPNFPVQYMPDGKGWIRRFRLRFVVRPQVSALGADVVYSRNLRAISAVASMGVPLVFEAHIVPSTEARLLEQAALFAHASFRRLVVISEALKQDYLDAIPTLDAGLVRVAHDGASPAPHLVDSSQTSERFQVGYVGHLYPGKGMELIELLARRCPWADFQIVGGLEEDLALWRGRLSDASNVTFHGFLPHTEAIRRLAGFDVVLAPYGSHVKVRGGGSGVQRWMSPLKLFEYMSYAKPIIASDLPVLREVLEDGRTALLAEPDDPDPWVAALVRLREDADLRRQLGSDALAVFEQKYTWTSRARWVIEGLGIR